MCNTSQKLGFEFAYQQLNPSKILIHSFCMHFFSRGMFVNEVGRFKVCQGEKIMHEIKF